MGYDMYHEEKPADEVAAYDQAYAKFQEKVAKRDAIDQETLTAQYEAAHKEVNAAFDEMGRAEAYYFRLNISGMSKYLDGMQELGMIDDSDEGRPAHSAWENIDFDSEEAEEKAEKLRTSTAEFPMGLPLFKFGSNDGWLVTPEEIQAALANYQKPPTAWFEGHKIEEDYWDEWIQFLQRAVERGGFRVY